jgi:hypothetical protein
MLALRPCRHREENSLTVAGDFLTARRPLWDHRPAMRGMSTLLVGMVVFSAESVVAQPTLTTGARVRLWLAGPTTDSIVGSVATVGRDTVNVLIAGGALQRVPLIRVLRLETSRGRKSRWMDGAIVGAALGASAGLIYAAQHTRSDGRARDPICWPDQCGESVTPGSSVSKPRAATVGALVGGALGVLFGSAARGPERWNQVWAREASTRQHTRVP